MKISFPVTVTALAVVLLGAIAPNSAQSAWQTVADFPCAAPAAVDALTKDAAGNLYAAISTSDAEGRMPASIRKSSDRGATWTVIEDSANADCGSARFLSLGADAANHLYAVGYAEDERGRTRWIVRKSGKSGNSWTTVDDFSLPGGQTTVAQGIAADVTGNLYVAGHGAESPSADSVDPRRHWLVRQSRDGGRTWSTIDDFVYGFSAKAFAIVSASNGLFVAGSGWNGDAKSGERWIVRKGTPDGAGRLRWQTVDELQSGERGQWSESRASALGVDVCGNLYAVGRSYAPPGGNATAHWIVRRATQDGLSWTVVDSFQLESGCFAAAWGVTASEQGGVFVVGQAAKNNSGIHWIVRHSATGEPDSWSVSDNFRLAASPPAVPNLASLFAETADGTVMATSPTENSKGLAILSASAGVFAGGSAFAGPGHAIVRKLSWTTSAN